MNEHQLSKTLTDLKLGGLRYFDSIGSTNDEALAWAMDGAADLSLVIADEQTHGRGRVDRKWFTPKGTALAFSLILRASAATRQHLSRTVGLAALAITESTLKLGLNAQIKWPNDILLNGRKTAGILVETVWSGNQAELLVIGIGINVMKAAVPPPETLLFPATSLEEALGYVPNREDLLHDILAGIIKWRPQMGSDLFLNAWEEKLAFHHEQVRVTTGLSHNIQPINEELVIGELLGLGPDGSLRLRGKDGKLMIVHFGDVSLRPAT
jgi:BirA family transcriptional regulator, biotin operon repressor / biotin---[acetyl-CoA-carboxylase] ligase